jgi:hypothetical protein
VIHLLNVCWGEEAPLGVYEDVVEAELTHDVGKRKGLKGEASIVSLLSALSMALTPSTRGTFSFGLGSVNPILKLRIRRNAEAVKAGTRSWARLLGIFLHLRHGPLRRPAQTVPVC